MRCGGVTASFASLGDIILAEPKVPAYAEADGTALIKTGDGSTMLVVDFGVPADPGYYSAY